MSNRWQSLKTDETSFKKELDEKLIYFKCFSAANAKQLDCFVVTALTDETSQTVLIQIGCNDITQILAQNLVGNIELKC